MLAYGQLVKRRVIVSFFPSCITFTSLLHFSLIHFLFFLFVRLIVLFPFLLSSPSHEISSITLALPFLYLFQTFLCFSLFPSLLFVHPIIIHLLVSRQRQKIIWGFPASHQLILTTTLRDFPDFDRK
jgi:hypothetical protein